MDHNPMSIWPVARSVTSHRDRPAAAGTLRPGNPASSWPIAVTSASRPAGPRGSDRRQAVAVGEHPRRDVEHRLVSGEEALQLVDHEAEEARTAELAEAGDVRRDEHVRQPPDLGVGRDRLRIEDVETDSHV